VAEGASGPPETPETPEAQRTRRGRPAGWRDVLIVAGVAVGAVLGAAILTSVLPTDAQRFIFHTPALIAVLILGTVVVLWRVAARRPPEP
jgi:MFS family permease